MTYMQAIEAEADRGKGVTELHFSPYLYGCIRASAAIAKLSIEDWIEKVLKIAKEPISLATPIGEDEDSNLVDFIEDMSAKNPMDEVTFIKLSEHTRNILDTLSPREASVLRLRFGIDCDADHTLEEVGKKFHVTRERIRQIEAKALRKLRHPARCRTLKAFSE